MPASACAIEREGAHGTLLCSSLSCQGSRLGTTRVPLRVVQGRRPPLQPTRLGWPSHRAGWPGALPPPLFCLFHPPLPTPPRCASGSRWRRFLPFLGRARVFLSSRLHIGLLARTAISVERWQRDRLLSSPSALLGPARPFSPRPPSLLFPARRTQGAIPTHPTPLASPLSACSSSPFVLRIRSSLYCFMPDFSAFRALLYFQPFASRRPPSEPCLNRTLVSLAPDACAVLPGSVGNERRQQLPPAARHRPPNAPFPWKLRSPSLPPLHAAARTRPRSRRDRRRLRSALTADSALSQMFSSLVVCDAFRPPRRRIKHRV